MLGFLSDFFQHLKLPEPIHLTYEDDPLVYENVELEGAGYFGKNGRLDVCVELKGHSKIAVKMQVQDTFDMSRRLQFYGDDKLFPVQIAP